MLHDVQHLIREVFDREALARICTMHETEFADAFGMRTVIVPERRGFDDWYAFRDNGASVLAVAHLDTVVDHHQRQCGFLETAAGEVCYSGALDDRLGAYVILDLLPKLGITTDLLLTTGEESGRSTAEFFDPGEKKYNWGIEFDRGGTDVVMYQYEDEWACDLVESTGARVGSGSFSDIAYLDQLGVKCFNWGVGYQDYHSTRGHVYLNDLFKMVEHFVDFHDSFAEDRLEHVEKPKRRWGGGGGWGWDDDDDDTISARTSMFGAQEQRALQDLATRYGGFGLSNSRKSS